MVNARNPVVFALLMIRPVLHSTSEPTNDYTVDIFIHMLCFCPPLLKCGKGLWVLSETTTTVTVFSFVTEFPERNRKYVLCVSIKPQNHLWKFGRTWKSCGNTCLPNCVATAFLVLPNILLCFCSFIETQYMLILFLEWHRVACTQKNVIISLQVPIHVCHIQWLHAQLI